VHLLHRAKGASVRGGSLSILLLLLLLRSCPEVVDLALQAEGHVLREYEQPVAGARHHFPQVGEYDFLDILQVASVQG
jgi:hypothetical protein